MKTKPLYRNAKSIILYFSLFLFVVATMFPREIYRFVQSEYLLKSYSFRYNDLRDKMQIIPIDASWRVKIHKNVIHCEPILPDVGQYTGKNIIIGDSMIYEEDYFWEDSTHKSKYIIQNKINKNTDQLLARDTSYGWLDSI